MNKSQETLSAALTKLAQKQLSEALGTKAAQILSTRKATGKQGTIYKIRGFNPEIANSPRHSVYLDETGKAVLPDDDTRELFNVPLTRKKARAARAPIGPGVITITPDPVDVTLDASGVAEQVVTVNVPVNNNRKVDVYLLADTTGSMGAEINAVKTGASNIVSNLFGLGLDMRIGVGNYLDFLSGDPFCFQHQLSPSNDAALINNAIGAWTLGTGGDVAEGQFFAFDQIAEDPGGSIGWRSDARKILVWFGDAPGHDPVCAAVSGLPYDISEASATAKLVSKSISVIAISVRGDGLNDAFTNAYVPCGASNIAAGQANRITAATGGSYQSGIDETQIVNSIINLVSNLAGTINNLSLVPAGGIVLLVSSITPATFGPLSGDTEHSLAFRVTFKGGCKNEDAVQTGALQAVADGVVVAEAATTVRIPACRPAEPEKPEKPEKDCCCGTPVQLVAACHKTRQFDIFMSRVRLLEEGREEVKGIFTLTGHANGRSGIVPGNGLIMILASGFGWKILNKFIDAVSLEGRDTKVVHLAAEATSLSLAAGTPGTIFGTSDMAVMTLKAGDSIPPVVVRIECNASLGGGLDKTPFILEVEFRAMEK